MILTQQTPSRLLPEIYYAGVQAWGGDAWPNNQLLPFDGYRTWGRLIGYKKQHHRLWINLARLENNRAGLDDQVRIATDIINGGGQVQLTIFGTPPSLYTFIPQDNPWHANRYPPADYKIWAEMCADVIDYFLRTLPADRLPIEIWTEASRYYWRGTDAAFYLFYEEVQRTLRKYQDRKGVKLILGAPQIPDMDDHQLGDQPYCSTPTWLWIKQFLKAAVRGHWQLDFLPYMQYNSTVGDGEHTARFRRYLDLAGYKHAKLHRNEVQTTVRLRMRNIPRYVAAERDSEIGAAWTIAQVHEMERQGVDRCELDFLQSVYGAYNPGPPLGPHQWPLWWGGAGLLSEVHALPKPRFTAARLMLMQLPIQLMPEVPPLELGKVPYILTTDENYQQLRLLVWNYKDHRNLGQTYEDVRRAADFYKSIDGVDTLFNGYKLDGAAIIDVQNNNGWTHVMGMLSEYAARLNIKDKESLKDKLRRGALKGKLEPLVQIARSYETINWTPSAALGGTVPLSPYSVALLEYRKSD